MKVESHRGLKNLDIDFDGPKSGENAVNVVIGKNGSGKTTVLELISKWFTQQDRKLEFGSIDISDGPDLKIFSDIANGDKKRAYTTNLANELETLTKGKAPPYQFPQFIYLPAMLQLDSSGYSVPLNLEYQLSTSIQENILNRTADYIREFVIAHERQQQVADAGERAQLAVAAFNEPFSSLKLSSKLAGLDANNLNAPFFNNIDGETFDINGLSDGEKQIYGRVVGLMMLQPRNSVILIDEPEIAIHPAWQYRILDVYQKIGTGNQFIVATHSPQILSSARWQSIQVIARNKDRTFVERLPGPPTGIDSVSILSEIMRADFHHPELHILQQKYRCLFEAKQESTSEGLELKKKLENLESRDSEFFQELRMIEKIRERRDANS